MKQCSQCGYDVIDSAILCPKCGFRFADDKSNKVSHQSTSQSNLVNNQTVGNSPSKQSNHVVALASNALPPLDKTKNKTTYTLESAPLIKRGFAALLDIGGLALLVYLFLSVIPFAGILLSWFYFTIMESSPLQGTFGKLLMKIRVTDTHGLKLSYISANIRFLAKLLCFIPFGLGFVAILVNPSRQGLHDLAAHSSVYKKKA